MNWWNYLSTQVKPDFTVFNLITLHYYGLFLAAGIITAIWIIGKRLSSYGFKDVVLEKIIWWSLVPGIIGARFYHVIDYWPYYQQQPIEIFKIWHGGIGIWGGIVGGLAGLSLLCKSQKWHLKNLTDAITPGVLLAQAIGRWGNFFNQEAYGKPTQLPWKISIDHNHRLPQYQNYQFFHPTFLYESIWNLIGFGLLWKLSPKFPKHGQITGGYLVWYGTGRFFLEFLRIDTATFNGIQTAQIFSLVSIIFGMYLLFAQKRSGAKL